MKLTADQPVTLASLVGQRMTYLGLTDRDVEARTEGAVSKSTVNAIVNGKHRRITEETITALASALDLPEDVLRLHSTPVPGQPYVPPVESARLTEAQRRLVDSVIRGLVER